MAYDDKFRLSVHAVIQNTQGKILQLKATYGTQGWGLPGGALEPGETIHQALQRECLEELGVSVEIKYMSGMYYHHKFHAQVCIFYCEIPSDAKFKLSKEHSEYAYFAISELSDIQKIRVQDCLNFDGKVKSASF
jgi:8-oxo-dGTP diphosphatase